MAEFYTQVVASGFAHTCISSEASGLWCWGYNSNGQLGLGNTIDENLPVSVSYFSGQTRSRIWPYSSRGLHCIGHSIMCTLVFMQLFSHTCQFTERLPTPVPPPPPLRHLFFFRWQCPSYLSQPGAPYILSPLPPGWQAIMLEPWLRVYFIRAPRAPEQTASCAGGAMEMASLASGQP